MSFANPQFLWLLLVVPPLLILFLWWSARARQRLMTQFIQARLLPGLIAGVSTARKKIRAVALVAAVFCLILALARPQWGFDWQEVTQRGLDIVVAIDTSKSMLAEDIAPNRLARAKLAALDLMQQAKSDRLGLVAFAGSAFLQCPLTIDDSAFRQSLDALDVNIIPEGGTAIAEAINEAARAFKEGENHKIVVLFTDGEDHDSEAVAAAKRAKDAGVIIFTVGIGSVEGELLRIKTADGKSDYVRDADGNVVKSHLNETLLQQIAGAAADGGFYLPLRGANTMDMLYQKGIAPLPKSDAQEKLVKRPLERYHWPLGLAIVLLIGEMLFPERRSPTRQEQKKNLKPAGSEAGAPLVAAIVALLLLPGYAFASPSSALEDYQHNKFEAAQKEYEHLLEKKRDDPRLHFNAGAAAYRGTNYDAAIQHFTAVLTAQDVKLQQAAYYNLGNLKFKTGELAENFDAIQSAWEEAVKLFQSAVTLDKNDPDARFNLDFAKRNLDMLAQMREAARRAKAAADAATRSRNYHRALEIMEALLQNNPTSKPFQEFTKKLKDIDAIATPPQP